MPLKWCGHMACGEACTIFVDASLELAAAKPKGALQRPVLSVPVVHAVPADNEDNEDNSAHHRKAVKVLTKKLGREPTEQELAKKVQKLQVKAASKGLNEGKERKKEKKEKKKKKKEKKKKKDTKKPGQEEPTPVKDSAPKIEKAEKTAATTPRKARVVEYNDIWGEDDAEEEERKKKKKMKKEKKKKKGKKRKAGSDSEDEAPKELKKVRVAQAPTQVAHASGAPNPDQVSKCFLGNVSHDIDDDQVKEYFQDCGGEIIDIYWLTDKETGKFKGCGFITFSEPSVAAAAVAKAGEDLLGRPLNIEFAAPRPGGDRPQAPPKKHRPTAISAKPEGCLSVYCGNLSYGMDDDAAKAFFKGCGKIKKIRWLTDFETGEFKGCGFIDFYQTESTDMAVALNGQQCLGRDIRLDYAVPTKKKEYDPSNPVTQARVSSIKPPASAVEHCALCRKTFTSVEQKKEHEGGKWHKQRLSGELNPSNKPYNINT